MRPGAAAAIALAAVVAAPAATAFADGPALATPEAALDRALHCPATYAHAGREPVLLVHGTSNTGDEAWSWNYSRALPALGFDACTVDLPRRALADIQLSTEYVVHAVRRMRGASGRRVDVVGHSQGPIEARWAIAWWPDVRASVDDIVGLSSPNHGATTIDALCGGSACLPALWQLRTDSDLLAALNAVDETPDPVDQTSVISLDDGTVTPAETSMLDGGSNVVLQEVCPGRRVDHGRIVYDAAAFAVVLDALTHPGGADPARVDRGVCGRDTMPHVRFEGIVLGVTRQFVMLPTATIAERFTSAEPLVREYARGPLPPLPSLAPAPPAAGPPARRALRLVVAPRGLRAGRRNRLRVAVRDASGRAVRGALVRAGARRARTDQAGRARLSLRPRRARSVLVRASARGHRPASRRLPVR